MLKALFLFSMAVTIALAALQFLGTDTVNLIIIMVIVDFLALGAYMEFENRKAMKESKEFMTSKLEGIEKVCNETLAQIKAPSASMEQMMNKHKSDISYVLDKITKKSLDLEERLNAFGRILSRDLEEKKVDEQKEELKKEQESYSVGEIVYMEDDADNK